MLLWCFRWAAQLPWLSQVWGFFVGFFFVSEMTSGNNALHFSHTLKIVQILQVWLIQFAVGPPVNTLGAFLMKVSVSSQNLE